ncbi:MMS19 nucleotide excision repair protein-like [Acipenser ruthenus]|uniref:MMS19 nucleotide excision repair protein n=1 Tax=Acipenser ruthenus TaxID=7906 RepID=A0A444UNZ4_ACIRT|nr:MMS19 nucleotide excision repair protein-like [Acipenser ruthenus]
MAGNGALLLGLVEQFVTGMQDSKAADTVTGVKKGQFTVLELVEWKGCTMAGNGALLLGLVEQFVTGMQDSKAADTVTGVKKGQFTVLELVEVLGSSLTSSEPRTRGRGIQLLSQVLQQCCTSLSEKEELKGLGADFVFGFVQAIDGEKDPRNLLLAFQIAQNILYRNYELGSFTEELFEVTSCYFPIDFYPPPNDPYGISREELILSLRAVLAGTPRFAEFLLPLLIEKLDSDVQSSKLDSLQTLAACAAGYGHKELKEFLPSLWSSVRREVFQTASEKVESAGLSALRSLTACLSCSVLDSDSEDSLDTFLDLVLKDCQHHLCEPDLKLVWPSTKLLQTAASASYRASYKITAAVVPLLLEQYNNHTQNAQRRTLVEVLQGFIQLPWGSHTEEGDENPLTGYRQPLCALVFSALTESSPTLQTAAVQTLTALGTQPGLLSGEDIDLAADHLTRLVLREEEPQTCSAAMEAAGSLARLHPTAFAFRMVPALKQEIVSAMEECEGRPTAQSQQALRQRSLKALSTVSTHPSLVQETVPIILQALCVSHKGSASFELEEVVSACRSLQQITELAKDSEESGRYFHQTVIPRLLGLAVQASLQGGGAPNPLIEERVLSAMVPIFSTACGCLHTQLAAHTTSLVLSLFLDGDASFLPENNFPLQFQLLKVEVPNTDRLLSELEELSCSCVHPFTHTSAAKCFAGLVNKHPAGEQLDSILKRSVKRIESGLGSDSPNRMQVFTLLLWVSKALLLRYHPLSTILTDKLLSLLVDRELGSLAADGFALLMNDSTDVLNRACHADVRMMYRQRFFTETAPKLVLGFNCAPEERKSSYLKALSHILNSLPRQVQITELPSLLPLLLEALSCPDHGVQLSTLSCLHPLLLDTPQVMTSHLETLLSRLLGLTASPAMKVRITSLQCLKALTRLPEHVVLPSRPRILRALAVPLGDKKRLVRREAVLARGEW